MHSGTKKHFLSLKWLNVIYQKLEQVTFILMNSVNIRPYY